MYGQRYYHDESGDFVDEYTVCYPGVKLTPFTMTYPYASLSRHPQAPDGVFQHGMRSDLPVGRRVTWRDLPPDVQKALKEEHEAA